MPDRLTEKVAVAVLASGRGSNLTALLRAAEAPAFPARIVLVIADRRDATALRRAADAGVPTRLIEGASYGDREAFDDALHEAIAASGARLICLAGFMRILGARFVERWAGRVLNIHPSLLPAFRGLHTHARALEAGVKLHGATVHLVTAALDEGPILAQAAVPVLANDDATSLAARVLAAEHKLYPSALASFIDGAPHVTDPGTLFNPPLR